MVEIPPKDATTIPPDWIVFVPESTAVTAVLNRRELVVKPAGIPPPFVTSVFTPGAYTSVPKEGIPDVRGTMFDPLLVAHDE